MKTIMIILLVLGTVSASAEEINLKAGESIRINSDVIRCEASSPMAGFVMLEWGVLRSLLFNGLYGCMLDYNSGSANTRWTSKNYTRELIGTGWGYNVEKFVRQDIKNGACDP